MKKIKSRLGWALCGAVAIALIATLARVSQAGPLDPPGPVGSTMKTIGDLVPAWHQLLSSSGGCTSNRFSCVMGGPAVLDSETGLVWQKTPANSASLDWATAIDVCNTDQTGGRMGWRLPSAAELLTLLDRSTGDNLPTGHPFTNVGTNGYWSATSAPGDESGARIVGYNPFISASTTANKHDSTQAGAWCVRGQSGTDFAAQSDGSWSKTLAANTGFTTCDSPRFECVLSGGAVLDHETGLVWDRSATGAGTNTWQFALGDCANRLAGGRYGWRLPSVAELSSLLDTSVLSPSAGLPAGNPFQNVPTASGSSFWTASEQFPASGNAEAVTLIDPSNGNPAHPSITAKTVIYNIWCVRGPSPP